MADRPRVLLIGDSIRLGYQQLVATRLGAAVEVSGPPGYCGDSGDVLKRLGDWIAPGTTLVAVNAGLHDLVRLARVGRNRVEIDRYEAISPASSGSSAPWGSPLGGPASIAADGVHLTADGYAVVADAVAAKVAELL